MQGSSLSLAPKALGCRGTEGDVLVVFLLPLRVMNDGTLSLSIWGVAARLGTLNSKIPSLFNVM